MDHNAPLSNRERIGYGAGCLVLLAVAAAGLYPVIERMRDASDRAH
jgi:hypothetical protein